MENQKIMRPKAHTDTGKNAGKFLWIALMAYGVFAGSLISVFFIEAAVARRKLSSEFELAEQIRGRRLVFAAGANSEMRFAEKNPFRAGVRSPQDIAINSGTPLKVESMVLRGTLPEVGAWVEDGGKIYLVLKGQRIGGHTLEEIKYNYATFASGGARHSIYLTISGTKREKPKAARSKRPAAQRPAARKRETEPPQTAQQFDVETATETQEGSVPRELVNMLLMNPYEELSKVRMIPMPDESGMKMERLAEDSILSRVGVKQGDVINAVNGVKIANAADASNALNSLLSGSRFDVTVIRGGAPIHLRYQVR